VSGQTPGAVLAADAGEVLTSLAIMDGAAAKTIEGIGDRMHQLHVEGKEPGIEYLTLELIRLLAGG
jgi:hypothetical protein